MSRFGIMAAAAAVASVVPLAAAIAQVGMSNEARLKMMEECDALKAEAIRLTCYDNAVRAGRSALGAERPGMQRGRSAAQPLTPEQRFGMTPKLEAARRVPQSRPLEVEEINARVATAADSGVGLWQITFADGARWQFIESDREFRPPNRGDEVRIRKAAMGSFLMYVGQQPSVRVVRVN